MRRFPNRLAVIVLVSIFGSCSSLRPIEGQNARGSDPVDPACVLPGAPAVVLEDGGVVLWVWRVPWKDAYARPALRTTRGFWPIERRSVRRGRKNDTPRSRSRPEQADPTLMFGATRVSTTTWPIEALWARSARSPVSMLSCLPRRTLAYHS